MPYLTIVGYPLIRAPANMGVARKRTEREKGTNCVMMRRIWRHRAVYLLLLPSLIYLRCFITFPIWAWPWRSSGFRPPGAFSGASGSGSKISSSCFRSAISTKCSPTRSSSTFTSSFRAADDRRTPRLWARRRTTGCAFGSVRATPDWPPPGWRRPAAEVR